MSIRRQNLEKLWNVLLRHKHMTRQALAKHTGLSLMSVSNLVDQLNAQKVLCFATPERPLYADGRRRAGRKAELVDIATDTHAWLVLDLTGYYFRLHALALDMSPLRPEIIHAYDAQRGYMENLTAFLHSVRLLMEGGLSGRSPLGIAVVTPGPYDALDDTVRNQRIPELNSIHIKETLQCALGPGDYFVEEDVKLAVRAYLMDADAPGSDLLYYLYIGEGVGGAIAYRGDVLLGLNAISGDAGQIRLWGPSGQTYERALSLHAFCDTLGIPQGGGAGEDELLQRVQVRALEDGPSYRQALCRMADTLARLLHSVIWMVDPRRIILDCRYALPEGVMFLTETRKHLEQLLAGSFVTIPEIALTQSEVRNTPCGAVQALSRQWLERIV